MQLFNAHISLKNRGMWYQKDVSKAKKHSIL